MCTFFYILIQTGPAFFYHSSGKRRESRKKMNTYQFIASQYPFKEIKNQKIILLSKNEAQKRNLPLSEGTITFETSNPDEKNILFFDTENKKNTLQILPDRPERYAAPYTEKKFVSKLVWTYSPELAEELLAFIREHMEETGALEVDLWAIWTGKTQSSTMRMVSLEDLSLETIKKIVSNKTPQAPEGLIITKE